MSDTLLPQILNPYTWAVNTGLLSDRRFYGLHPWLAVSRAPYLEKLDLAHSGAETEFIRFAGKFDDPKFPEKSKYFAFFIGTTEQVSVMYQSNAHGTSGKWKHYRKFSTFWDWYKWAIDDASDWQKLEAEVRAIIEGRV